MIVIDTNLVSELMRAAPDGGVAARACAEIAAARQWQRGMHGIPRVAGSR